MTEPPPRIGLVLGAGGVTGGAFHAGVLSALHAGLGWDPRTATIIVGTSAGSIAATTLRAGLSAADMLARAEDLPLSFEGSRLMRNVGPPRRPPPLRPAMRGRRPAEIAAVLTRAATRPFSAPPWALLSSLIPDGPVSTAMISDTISELFPDDWPDAPTWLCAVRQSDGRRFAFGKHEPLPPLADAVAASCAIPGFFSPVTIDGEAFVDGGVHSPTNADVLVGEALDLIIVSSPMSITGRRGYRSTGSVVRRWSGALLDAEVVRLRRHGVPVVALQPTPDDVEVMGGNAMDPGRRGPVARQVHESSLRRLARADTRERLAVLLS
ncbi:MAG: patatin-like phospholipase family protein [Ilumatobacteraceae bacterium]